jgi:ribosomal protein L6P/L9E
MSRIGKLPITIPDSVDVNYTEFKNYSERKIWNIRKSNS